MQRRAGLREAAERVGRIIAPGLPREAGRRLLARHRLAVAATVDAEGRPRATLLTGREGFLESLDDDLVHIAAPFASGAPIARDLGGRPELGLLAFDPTRRQRLRLNGRAQLAPEGLDLLVDQAYGNCTKYIQLRRLVADEARGAAGPLREGRELSARQSAWIERSDTLFIASFHPSAGADASHRGGLPGFVRVEAADRLSFADYPGNAMFNTLGNLVAYPRLALLFVDFATGDLLEVAGEARVGPRRRRRRSRPSVASRSCSIAGASPSGRARESGGFPRATARRSCCAISRSCRPRRSARSSGSRPPRFASGCIARASCCADT